MAIVGKLINNRRHRYAAQMAAAMTVRERFDPQAHALALGAFLRSLHAIERWRWSPHREGPVEALGPFVPTRDRTRLQSFERALLGRPADVTRD